VIEKQASNGIGANFISIRVPSLSVTVSDPAPAQIVRRHFDGNAIAHQNPDAMSAQLTGNSRQYNVLAVVELNFEECVGLLINNSALSRNQIIFCQ